MTALIGLFLAGGLLVRIDDPMSEPSPMKAYTDCLLAAAQKDDDQRSDAATIALSIETSCVEQFRAVEEWYTRDMSPIARQETFDKFNQSQLQVAIGAVLTVRRSRSAPPSN
jgi:hypothetical protein